MYVPDESPSHPVFAALYDTVMHRAEATLLPPHREYLVRGLSGRVLDVGAGTGALFPYLDQHGGDAEIHAVEPDPHMRRRAVERATDLGLEVEMRPDRAEDLSYEDGSFNVVTGGIVFCTIPDPATALGEVARVLRQGGEFRFLEHVHDRGWRGRFQAAIQPLWGRVAGGCHLTRETGSLFTTHEAFEVADIERFEVGITPVRPFIRGTLRRR